MPFGNQDLYKIFLVYKVNVLLKYDKNIINFSLF